MGRRGSSGWGVVQIVDSWPESLKNVSSRLFGSSLCPEALVGNCARGSCSTYLLTPTQNQVNARSSKRRGGLSIGFRRGTVISKSTIFSAKVLISFEKQNEYSPAF